MRVRRFLRDRMQFFGVGANYLCIINLNGLLDGQSAHLWDIHFRSRPFYTSVDGGKVD